MGSPCDRIQFTPDLMPSDILGTNIFSFQKSEFSFVPGPVFTTFLLAMRLIEHPVKPNQRFCRRCKNARVP